MAAYGEAPQGVAVERLFLVLLRVAGITGNEPAEPEGPAAPAAAPLDVPLTEDRILDERNDAARFVLAANRERAEAAERRARLIASGGSAVGMGRREHRGRSTVAAGRSTAGRAVVRRRCVAEPDQRGGERPDRLHNAGHHVLARVDEPHSRRPAHQRNTALSSSAASPSSRAASRSRSCARRSSGSSTRCSWRRARPTRRHERCRPPWCGASVTRPPAIRSCSASSTAVPASSPPSKRPSRPSVPPARRCGPASASLRRSSRWSRALHPRSGRGSPAAGTSFGTTLALATMRRDDAALDTGSIGRDLAEVVVESIGAELTLPSRDPQFASPRSRPAVRRDRGGAAHRGQPRLGHVPSAPDDRLRRSRAADAGRGTQVSGVPRSARRSGRTRLLREAAGRRR